MVELIALVKQGMALATNGGRADLVRRLEHTEQRLLDPNIRVIVVGEFKQGKSQFVNALVNAPVCPVDDDIATSVPTVVRYGEKASAAIVTAPGARSASSASFGPEGVATERHEVDINDLASYVSERGNPGNNRRLTSAEVCLPRSILSRGLIVIDSPGVGGLDSAHSLATLTALPTADAMLLVSDASQELTEPEVQFLRQAMRISPNVACVLSKTDLYPEWRRVAELDRGHLDRVRDDIPLFSLSSDLRLHAARLNDAELNVESGFPPLITFLRDQVVGQAEKIQKRSTAQDLLSTTEHLRLALQSELSALTDPQGTPKLLADLEAAKDHATELRRKTSRWQITLSDGMADLISDMEHDLRDRMRSIQREAEASIDEGDPAPTWEQMIDWLEQRVAAAISDTFVWTNERSVWLASLVAEHFSRDEVPLPTLHVDNTDDVLESVELVPMLDDGRIGVVQKVLIGMRGSYGGVLMFGLLTGIVGMALINPFSIAAGVLIGGKAYKDDKSARLKRRQAEAKILVRRQMDDVIFQVGKQLKDRMRLVQRTTRDHFTEIADESLRSLSDSVLAAQKAATTFTAEREQRAKELRIELKKVEDLAAHARALEPRHKTQATEDASVAAAARLAPVRI
ncbi:dynamin family protein [Agreia sp.]|uniref:dynamin family protein n=1 Tax=Agreia sp. TaxID=1872416 RepID=UPI0035BBD0A9